VALQKLPQPFPTLYNRMPKVIMNHGTNGLRWLGRPLKSLLDEAETGLLRSNSWRMTMKIC
jgi:hypothetical protein